MTNLTDFFRDKPDCTDEEYWCNLTEEELDELWGERFSESPGGD